MFVIPGIFHMLRVIQLRIFGGLSEIRQIIRVPFLILCSWGSDSRGWRTDRTDLFADYFRSVYRKFVGLEKHVLDKFPDCDDSMDGINLVELNFFECFLQVQLGCPTCCLENVLCHWVSLCSLFLIDPFNMVHFQRELRIILLKLFLSQVTIRIFVNTISNSLSVWKEMPFMEGILHKFCRDCSGSGM